MLILTRKVGEQIVITHPDLPGEIVVEFCQPHGNHARIGIEAHRSVRIVRAELLDETETETEPLKAA